MKNQSLICSSQQGIVWNGAVIMKIKKDLESIEFKLNPYNPYNPYIAYCIVNSEQQTVTWRVNV